jgi:CRISPR/Cas system-associated endonuclease Cas3-HD
LQVYSLFLLPLVVSDNLDSTRRGDDEDRRLFIVELKNIYGD